VPVGTTGESPTLSHEEHETVIEVVVKAAAGVFPSSRVRDRTTRPRASG
jgi:dihydrodipicolinate synthase/N-acetylneuraminate lyase